MLSNLRPNITFTASKALLLANLLLFVAAGLSLYLSALPLLLCVLLTFLLIVHFFVFYRHWSKSVTLIAMGKHYVLQHGYESLLLIDVYYVSSYLIIFRCQARGRIQYCPILWDMCSEESFHYFRLYSKGYISLELERRRV